VVLPESDASEEVLREYPEASEWVGLKSPFATPDDKLNQFKRAETGADQLRELIGGSGVYARLFPIWSRMRSDLSKDRVVSPTLSIPIGLYRDRWGESFFLCVSARYPEQLLYRTAPTDAVRSDFRDFFCRIYHEKALWRERFDERAAKGEDWHLELMRLEGPIVENGYEPFGRRTGRWIDAPPALLDEGSLDATFAAWKEKKFGDGDFLWLPSSVLGEDGGLAIDVLFERATRGSLEEE
jgi:hypothetical protein